MERKKPEGFRATSDTYGPNKGPTSLALRILRPTNKQTNKHIFFYVLIMQKGFLCLFAGKEADGERKYNDVCKE